MLLDSGKVTIKRGANTAPLGSLPVYTYSTVTESYYGEKTVGINRYWTAKANNAQADLLIQIPRNGGIKATDIAVLSSFIDDGTSGTYRIIQVQHLNDEDNNFVTELTLERVEAIG